MKAILWRRLAAIMCLGTWLLTGAAHAKTYWELEPVAHPKVPHGTSTLIGGRTTPEGVHFKLTKNDIHMPLVVTLTAKEKAMPLHLRIYKESGTLFEKDTDASGLVTRSFRTGEDMLFDVTGPAGAEYQLSVWRGPKIILPHPCPVKAMSDAIGKAAADAAATALPAAASTTTANPGGGHSWLLGGILAVLIVIAVLMFRGQQMRGRAPLFIAAFFLQLNCAWSQEGNVDIRPHPVDDASADPRHAEQIQGNIDKIKKLMEGLKTITEGKVDFNTPIDIKSLEEKGFKGANLDIAGLLQTALNLLEAFEVIDPREKFIAPDYTPPGLPVLPSRAVRDSSLSPEVYGEFRGLQDKINKAKVHLEGNYVVLKQTELKTKRLEELADSAGGFSSIAGLYWSTAKANPDDPMNKSKAGFYAKYDEGQESGLNYLNDVLKEFAEFEIKQYGDRNWYLYFGLPYYNFMVARYVRK